MLCPQQSSQEFSPGADFWAETWGLGKSKLSHRAAGSEAALKITHPAWLGNSKKDQQLPPGAAN